MMRKGLAGQRLVAVFLAGMLLLNYPILSLFDRPASLFGLPLLHVYLFSVWLGLIVAVAWIVERVARCCGGADADGRADDRGVLRLSVASDSGGLRRLTYRRHWSL